MIDPKPHKIGALEWYLDGLDGQRTHTWAEKPCPAPAILCESVEQVDELLAARERCEELADALRDLVLEPDYISDMVKCTLCGARWYTGTPKKHRDDCALAPRGDKATE